MNVSGHGKYLVHLSKKHQKPGKLKLLIQRTTYNTDREPFFTAPCFT